MGDSQDTTPGLVTKVSKKIPAVKPILRSRTLDSSSSTQDLRVLDVEYLKDGDDNLPRVVFEDCNENLDTDDDSSTTCIPHKHHGFQLSKFFKRWKKKSLKHLSSKSQVKKICSKVIRIGEHAPAPQVNANFCKMKASWKIFSFSELQMATNHFSKDSIIGKGGFSEVHKGCLKGGQLIAVKHLTSETHEERVNCFLSELGIMAHLDHPNTAMLYGYGVEGGLYIVMELSSLGSLGSLLHKSTRTIEWKIRYKIALGIAEGILYLHEGCQRRIIHRDIKADNILLTENYEPQICDFGLAKWLPKQWSHHTVCKFEGTFGYFAPEYFMHGIVDEKTDVYAFGILLLELISGQRAFDNERQSILLWAKPLLDEHDLKELVDPALGEDYDEEELDRLVLTASLCTQQTPVLRPRMSQVAILLRGYDPNDKKGNRAQTLRRTYSEEILDAREYNATKQLHDLRRHRQVAFGSETSGS